LELLIEMKIEIRGVEKLSFRERQVVSLKEMGYSTNRIAKQLSLSASTVNTLFSRARSKGYEVVIVISGNNLALFGVDDENDTGGEKID
jgi:orotate phosphoribosyltransferase-like protein